MRIVGRIGVGIVMVGLASFACSSKNLDVAGAGGNDGAAGGQAGGTGGVSETLALPGCLRDLLAPCDTHVACEAATAPAGWGEFCFASGVRASLRTEIRSGVCAGADIVSVTKVNKADGTLCYTWESTSDAACEVRQLTWTNAAGVVVARGTAAATPDWAVNITCEATSESTACGGPPPIAFPVPGCCNFSQFGAAVCVNGVTMGACAVGTCP